MSKVHIRIGTDRQSTEVTVDGTRLYGVHMLHVCAEGGQKPFVRLMLVPEEIVIEGEADAILEYTARCIGWALPEQGRPKLTVLTGGTPAPE